MDRFDVVVVGSGPSGGSAAFHLARSGARVLVLEKERLPRHKLCSGVLTGYSQRAAARIIGRDLGGAVLGRAGTSRATCGGASLTVRHRELVFVDRATFDHAIVQRAAQLGAEIRDRCRVTHARLDRDVIVDYLAPGGEVRRVTCRYVIGAGGAEGPLSRRLQRDRAIALGHEARIPYDGPPEPVLDWSIPSGYYWLFPKADGTAGVGGCTVDRSLWPHLREAVRSFWRGRGVELPGDMPGHRMRYARGRVAARGLFLVGESSGSQDRLLWEGIRFALATGELAAKAIVEGDDPVRAYRVGYALKVRQLLRRREMASRISSWTVVSGVLRVPGLRHAVVRHMLG